MTEQHSPVLPHLMAMAQRFSGRSPLPSDRIYADLNINGGDFLEFVVEVERHFGVDLSWVSPRQGSGEAQDPTIQALAEDVIRQQG